MIESSGREVSTNCNEENVFFKTIYLSLHYTCIHRNKAFLKESLDNFLTLEEDPSSHLAVAQAQFSVGAGGGLWAEPCPTSANFFMFFF